MLSYKTAEIHEPGFYQDLTIFHSISDRRQSATNVKRHSGQFRLFNSCTSSHFGLFQTISLQSFVLDGEDELKYFLVCTQLEP